MARLESQVILLSGGADALGRAVLQRCVEEGGHAALLEPDGARAAVLAAEFGDALLIVEGDPASPAAQRRALDAILARHRALHGFIAHAPAAAEDPTLAEMPGDERLARDFHLRLDAGVLAALCGARVMAATLAREHGAMVFTLGAAARRGARAGALASAVAHAGVALVSALAAELAPRVRVNGVCLSASGQVGGDLAAPRPLATRDVLAPRYAPDPWAQADAYLGLLARHGAPAMTGTLVEIDDTPIAGVTNLA